MADRLAPHDVLAEENVIGSLLLDGDLVSRLNLESGDFYHEPTRLCFAACKELAVRNVKINQVTLSQALKEHGQVETIGGPPYLSRLMADCVDPNDCEHYAAIVKRLALDRRVIQAGEQITDLGYSMNPDVATTLNQADEILLGLRKNGLSSSVMTPDQYSGFMVERYVRLRDAEGGIAVSTGLLDLDREIGGGLCPGEMAVVAGRTGMGKTTFIMNVAHNASKTRNALICSAEMTLGALTDRDIAAQLGVPTNVIRRGGYDENLYDRICGEGIEQLRHSRVYRYHEAPMTTEMILQKGFEVQLRYGLGLIVVDYLGLLADEYGHTQYERIGHISGKIKHIAMKLNVPVLCAHQLSRAVEAREDKHPELSDLRDSGKIEEDADLVLFLYRDSYYYEDQKGNNVTDIMIAKQRQGESRRIVRVFYDKEHQQYRDLVKETK